MDFKNLDILKNNTSSMIDLQLTKMKSTGSKDKDTSSDRISPLEKTPTDLSPFVPSKLEKFASLPVQNSPDDLDDEFFECVDEIYDLKILEGVLKEEKSE